MARQKKKKDDQSPKQAAFLAAYAKCGNITYAAKTAKIERASHYHWLESDPDYPARFDTSHAMACDWLEHEARRRAEEGVLEPVFYKGEKVASVRKYSDSLLMFVMKGAMPEKYRENVKISADVNANVKQKWVPPEDMITAATADFNRFLATRSNGNLNGTMNGDVERH